MLPFECEHILRINCTFDSKHGTGAGYELSVSGRVFSTKAVVKMRNVKVQMQLIPDTVQGMQHCQRIRPA